MEANVPHLILAPLRGVTGLRFRRATMQVMGGLDEAVAPFIATVAGDRVKPELLRGVNPAVQPENLPLVPQVIGKDPAQLRVMLRAFQSLGYKNVDLNAGCPWPFVAKKGRGSGLLKDPAVLESMVAAGCEVLGAGHFSIKVRLGLDDKLLLRKRLPILNKYPLRLLCVHARTAKQMYEGEVDLDAFEQVTRETDLPLVYNGDLRSLEDYQRLQTRFPAIHSWMIGRGQVANPFLAESIHAGHDTWSQERFIQWHTALYASYASDAPGDHALLGRMKELWSYLAPTFPQGNRLWDSIKLTRTRAEFERVLRLRSLF